MVIIVKSYCNFEMADLRQELIKSIQQTSFKSRDNCCKDISSVESKLYGRSLFLNTSALIELFQRSASSLSYSGLDVLTCLLSCIRCTTNQSFLILANWPLNGVLFSLSGVFEEMINTTITVSKFVVHFINQNVVNTRGFASISYLKECSARLTDVSISSFLDFNLNYKFTKMLQILNEYLFFYLGPYTIEVTIKIRKDKFKVSLNFPTFIYELFSLIWTYPSLINERLGLLNFLYFLFYFSCNHCYSGNYWIEVNKMNEKR
uniref:Uncharacterized protein n=1 Tax=Heterorhabditis bacteriophora TaxID=37862 RepID=A0A1I7WHB5_HETBA